MNAKLFILTSACFLFLATNVDLYAYGITNPSESPLPSAIYSNIKPDTMRSDDDLTRAIKEEFSSDPTLSSMASYVDVSTIRGMVTLTGILPSEYDRAAFQERAESIAGYGKVVNHINVELLAPTTR